MRFGGLSWRAVAAVVAESTARTALGGPGAGVEVGELAIVACLAPVLLVEAAQGDMRISALVALRATSVFSKRETEVLGARFGLAGASASAG